MHKRVQSTPMARNNWRCRLPSASSGLGCSSSRGQHRRCCKTQQPPPNWVCGRHRGRQRGPEMRLEGERRFLGRPAVVRVGGTGVATTFYLRRLGLTCIHRSSHVPLCNDVCWIRILEDAQPTVLVSSVFWLFLDSAAVDSAPHSQHGSRAFARLEFGWFELECTDDGIACYSFKVISEKAADLSISSVMMPLSRRCRRCSRSSSRPTSFCSAGCWARAGSGCPWRVLECDNDVRLRGVRDVFLLCFEDGHDVRSDARCLEPRFRCSPA